MEVRKMKKIYTMILAGLAATVFLALHGERSATAQMLAREVQTMVLGGQVPLPGLIGRIDHFSADLNRRLLIFCALGNNTVEIVNLFEFKQVYTIRGFNEPQGVLYVPGFDKLFVASAGDGTVKIFDGKMYGLRKSIKLGDDANNLRWDEASKQVFVGYGGDRADGTGAIAVIDPSTEARVGRDLNIGGGKPGSFQLERNGSRIYVNIPVDGSLVEAIDRKTGELTKWRLNGATLNVAMALNEDDQRLFVITRKPPLLIVLDTQTGKEVARLPVGGVSDDVYFDASRKLIYVICGQGVINVLKQDDPDHYELVENIPTAVGARTGYFHDFVEAALPATLSIAVPANGTQPAQIWNYSIQ
jgi:hypothetical protein